MKAAVACAVASATAVPLAGSGTAATAAGRADPLVGSPIEHVVVIYQENHSFNDLLGRLCVDEGLRCAGTTVGKISDGTEVPLAPEPDVPAGVGHNVADQIAAINGGAMNGWDHILNCNAGHHYQCLQQAGPGAVPNLWSLAEVYAMSDATFESGPAASWGSHLELVAATLDGFRGDQPVGGPLGAGCDSGDDALWAASAGSKAQFVPSCVPDMAGNGPYRPSPVSYVPTIMDRLESAGRTWHIYAPPRGRPAYGWAICPTFYECLGGPQAKKVRQPSDFARDASRGTLPNLSIVIPSFKDSQHPGFSLIRGDNWIAKNVSAVMNGPDWDSTAIFITYDDCGCFYDPARPPLGAGIREPMVIVSPYAKPRFVDHETATHVSLLAFTEHLFGLPPLNAEDATAYDYAGAFDFAHTPLPSIPLPQHLVPLSSVRYIAAHPPDPEDPT